MGDMREREVERAVGTSWPCTTGVVRMRAGRVFSVNRPICGLKGST